MSTPASFSPNADGSQDTYTYNTSGQLDHESRPGGVTLTPTYDAIGEQTGLSATGASGNVSDNATLLDAQGRVRQITQTDASGTATQSIDYNAASEGFPEWKVPDYWLFSSTFGYQLTEQFHLQLVVNNRRIHQSGLLIPINNQTGITVKGSVGFDQTLALRADGKCRASSEAAPIRSCSSRC